MNRKLINRQKTIVEILEIARNQIDDDNFESLNLREIAKDLGVSAPAVLHYFSTKEHLKTQLLVEGFSEFFQYNLEKIIQHKNSTPEELISILINSSRGWTEQNPNFALWIINHQLMSNNFEKYKDFDNYKELKKVSRYNTYLLAKLIQLVRDNEVLIEETLIPDNLENMVNEDAQAVILAGKHGLPLAFYNLYLELGTSKANQALFKIVFEQYFKELHEAIITDAIKSKQSFNI